MQPTQIWQAAKAELELQMTQATFDTWVHGSHLFEHHDTTWVIAVKNGYAKDWLEHRLLATIKRTLARLTGTAPTLKFVVAAEATNPRTGPGAGPPAACASPGNLTDDMERLDSFHDPDLPPDCQIPVELVKFDPRDHWGWTIIANYELQFWQPLLALLEKATGARNTGIAFTVWATLRTFPAHWSPSTHKPDWPSIQLLADTCAKGDRHKIIGRAARAGRNPVTGALQLLHEQNLAIVLSSHGAGPDTRYRLKVLDRLPLLTPAQVAVLPDSLQRRHLLALSRSDLDILEWTQLTLPTLAPDTAV